MLQGWIDFCSRSRGSGSLHPGLSSNDPSENCKLAFCPGATVPGVQRALRWVTTRMEEFRERLTAPEDTQMV